jgi:hypothetical protein
MKVFNYVRTFEINLVRDHYTRYGLHLNTKGKDYVAKSLRSIIKNILNIGKFTPIIMNWKEIHEVPSSKNLVETRMQSSANPETINKQVE